MVRKRELDSRKLFEAIETAATVKGLSLRKACEAAGVSQNTTTRLKGGMKVEADILLALLDWLGVRSVRRYMREVERNQADVAEPRESGEDTG